MGLLVRAQLVKKDIEGVYASSTISDGINTYYVCCSKNATEQISYSRYDIFFGASRNTGIFRPYGGLGLTQLVGTYSFSYDETISVSSNPVGGGAVTYTNSPVTINSKGNISGTRIFTGVLGLSMSPDDVLGMTIELQYGVENAILMAGSVKF